jgi:hypothetical protein
LTNPNPKNAKIEPVEDKVEPIEDKIEPIEDLDEYDPEKLRLKSNLEASVAKTVILTLSVRSNPPKQDFVRTHPTLRLDVALLELKEEREFYLVRPEMYAELAEEIISVRLYLTATRLGGIFLWAVRLPSTDGRRDLWQASRENAAVAAMTDWVRVIPNLAAGMYDTRKAAIPLPEPEWPELSLSQLLKLAFGERDIRSVDHPIVRRLRGLA